MPSRRSPSQREKAFRIDRTLGLFGGNHAGRVTNATPATVTTPSVPVAVPVGAVVIPVLHGDPATLVEGLLWFDLDATC